MKKCFSLLFLLAGMVSCHNNSTHEAQEPAKQAETAGDFLTQYNFDKPDEIINLPEEMWEISGINFINDSVIAAISDGEPYLYLFNIRQKTIIKKITVVPNGDFEDVTVCGDTAYIIQSNGTIQVVAHFNGTPVISALSLPLAQPFETEGLCHNATNDSLFIAAKFWHQQDSTDVNELPVWAFSIKQMKLVDSPLFNIPVTIGSEKKKHFFHTSGIMRIHGSYKWVVISTNKKFIAQLNERGIKETIIPLERDEFTQPEGIDTDVNGTLYISNEGKGEKPTILVFKKKS